MKHLRKIAILWCACSLHSIGVFSQQNLVPNPSFELNTSCPDVLCQIHRSTGWSSWGYSPDYYNSCAAPYPVTRVSIPQNDMGYQYAFTGNAYAGFYASDSGNSVQYPNLREYLAIQLLSTLTIGQKYFVRFRVSLADVSTYGVNKLGALFTTNSYAMDSSVACTNTNTSLLPRNFAHVYTSVVIMDTANWTQILGSFTADSAYRYLAIGNHFKDANILHFYTGVNSCCAAYYYVDDIYVGTDSLAAVGIDEAVLDNSVFVFPNPVSDQINIRLNNSEKGSVEIYNLLGILVSSFPLEENEKVDVSHFSSGIYYFKITIREQTIVKKIIITH